MEHEETQKNTRNSWSLVRPSQMISISFLSLLLPLSFLFLSRLSLYTSSAPVTVSGVFSVLHQADVGVLYTILFLIIVFTLIHSLLGKPECSVLHSHLYICWIVLFIAQACAFGIKRTMSTTMSINPDKNLFLATHERCALVRVLFFLGLHGVMLMWFRVVVKPVVDNTIYGVYVEERWSERAVVALTFGLMWWWRLRDEVESLVVVVTEDKRNLPIRLEGFNFVNWCMYYICVGIGLVKIFKGFLYFVNMLVLTIRRSRKGYESCVVDDHV